MLRKVWVRSLASFSPRDNVVLYEDGRRKGGIRSRTSVAIVD
jgi:hypothetical protein